MRLPQHLVESLCFTFPNVDDFISTLQPGEEEANKIRSIANRALPPVVSQDALATMLGINPGIIWSFAHRQQRHYSTFKIPKGNGERQISAPRVALKVLQAWLSHHLARSYDTPAHVFGFVPGRSHIGAALLHANAEWAVSVDIRDFFSTTPAALVREAYICLGYTPDAADLLTSLSTLNGVLPQGAPTSPPLSNICFRNADASLLEIGHQFGATLTRYADDVVFSGSGNVPTGLFEAISAVFAGTPWSLREDKTEVFPLKGRIKIHGLVIRDGGARLSKGYRNKLRAYAHILRTRDEVESEAKLRGHLAYAQSVAALTGNDVAPLLHIPPRKIKIQPAELEVRPRASKPVPKETMLAMIQRAFDKLKAHLK